MLFWIAMTSLVVSAHGAGADVVYDFEGAALPANLTLNNVEVELISNATGEALLVRFKQVDWPNVFFTAPEGAWDWREYRGLAVDITNPGEDPVNVCMRVDNEGADGANHCNTARALIPAGKTGPLKAEFLTDDAGPLWGMRGIPGIGPLAQGKKIDSSKIVAFQVFLPMPAVPTTLILDNVRLFGRKDAARKEIPLPFVDRFGQYIHDDWPGKVTSEKDLLVQKQAEREDLLKHPGLPDRDRFGGWASGPKLEATGWFRTEKVEGKWWLVTPEGNPFFSNGIDCVGTWERTFVEGRDAWFEWLPGKEDPAAAFFGFAENVHSMADAIGGKGRTFSFYCTNLLRKYGDEWATRWREESYRRLLSWGFNTIGNWSQGDVLENSPMPFVSSIGIGGNHLPIRGGGGYWGKMHDVFDPEFEKSVEKSVAYATTKFASNPLCIGYFVDNELSWGSDENPDIAKGTLRSPTDQPCRVAFIEDLKEKYGSLKNLNKVWETESQGWDELTAPEKPNEACKEDFDAFVHKFSLRYFETIKAALRKSAPHQLYLGCRFAAVNRESAKACAEVCDVASYNIYKTEVDTAQYGWLVDLNCPALIGEFHFGALDRGMFHTGLVPTANQAERAESYIRYVRSVADHPSFVGCHWFQYVDEPITGRFFDGENYNNGFVNTLDTPYPEIANAARQVHKEVYPRHYGKAKMNRQTCNLTPRR